MPGVVLLPAGWTRGVGFISRPAACKRATISGSSGTPEGEPAAVGGGVAPFVVSSIIIVSGVGIVPVVPPSRLTWVTSWMATGPSLPTAAVLKPCDRA